MGNHEGLEEFAAIPPSPLAPGPPSGQLHLFFQVGSIDAIPSEVTRMSDVAEMLIATQ